MAPKDFRQRRPSALPQVALSITLIGVPQAYAVLGMRVGRALFLRKVSDLHRRTKAVGLDQKRSSRKAVADREVDTEVTGRGKSRRDAQYGLLTAVANEADVSLGTVSKVVHRRRDVSEATRARIEELLTRHGYVRAWEAEARRPRQILAVFRDLSSPYTLEVTRGIVESAADMGVNTIVGTTSGRSIAQWLEECLELGALGLVIVISMLTEQDQRRILGQHVPVVLIDPLHTPSTNIPSIGATNWHGATTAVQHLIGLGHRRIGMLAGRSSSVAGAARLHGYRAALEEAGISYDPAIVRSTDFDYDEALVAARKILSPRDRPTALFAASDTQALGVLEAARQLGMTVPQDLSVMSFDDTLVAAMASPPLSAVRQPFQELGHEATRILLQLAEGKPPATMRMELATELVLRMSTAPPR
ncbi:LacI family DNA-binding transcriptional regulator [Nonomuraea sp. NEAU-A123]|uniref:LacI family DNA-binding transcriptional regulator n=1 Tax=Nonomuraea sp. NEAU-A123 TaxID=2839649 RepID=UPI001BE4846E|nr:LacI family DNA-binding transcriptional regulator [Nonomuraea sp. NEAU-A123]MBT2225044.1 LacI family DNA-binding transcriptional regulator [Nonomuraea sp. NEAU-A123]